MTELFKPTNKTVYVAILDPTSMKYTLWNRFKTAMWNFILPPHIRLNLRKPEIKK